MSELDPWRDPTYYQNGPMCNCLGCGNPCHKTHWGKWCFECNVERIERISKSFEELLHAQPR
jgi:hypothetical protein